MIFVDQTGHFLGHFYDCRPDDPAAVVVPTAPDDSAAVWDFAAQGWTVSIDQKRARAVLSKVDFCKALFANHILTDEAAVVEVALGKWPAQFDAAIAGLDVDQRVDAKLAWAGAAHVSRDAPLFLQLLAFFAAQQGQSNVQAEALGDQIFGIIT